MSKERELLKQIQQFLLCDCEDIYGFARDIEQLLEQPEEDQTPYCNTGLLEVWENGHDTGLRSAETTREPLSDELLEECLYLIVAFEDGCDHELYSNETGDAIELLRQKLGGFHEE
jgi:hypothetical protein